MKIIILSAIVYSFILLGLTACKVNVDNATTERVESSLMSSEATLSENVIEKDKNTFDFPSSFMVESQNNYFDYQPGLECAAFSSAYLLRHYGEDVEGLKLFENFPSKIADGSGVFPQGITTLFYERKFVAEFKTDATVDEIKNEVYTKKAPVIVFIHVTPPVESIHKTHYVPVVGYDGDNLYFAESLDYMANYKDEEGLMCNRKTDIQSFMKLWENIDGAWDNPYFSISNKTK